jgi:hypothetical protein
MKKLLYLFDGKLYNEILNPIGMSSMYNKVHMQTKAFSESGYRSYVISKAYNSVIVIFDYYNDNYSTIIYKDTMDYYNKILRFINDNAINLVYARKFLMDFFSFSFFEELAKIPELKVVMEFPTIPYDDELPLNMAVDLAIDTYYRNRMHKHILYSTNYNQLDSVFGIKSLPILNGIDLECRTLKAFKPYKREELNIVSVSSLYKWNGCERIILGLAEYYKTFLTRRVYLHIVGHGEEVVFYKHIVREHKLSEYVRFHGEKRGKELDEIFDFADIGLMSLGFYKIKLDGAAPLRTGEYMSRGLPFIYAFNNYAISDDYKYALRFVNDASIINIGKITEFWDIINTEKDYGNKIRDYAADNLTWNKMIEKILRFCGEISD